MRRAFLAAAVLLLVGVGIVASVTVPEHRTGYLGPIFTPDGTAIVVVRRELDAWVFGPGWEMLTPPARIRIRRDRYSVVRLDRRTGEETLVATLPPSPLEGTWIRAYRSAQGFGWPQAGLSWQRGALEWRVATTSAGSEPQRTYAIASSGGPSAWTEVVTGGVSGDDSAVLSGDDEVLVVPAAPCVVVLLNEARKTVHAVSAPERCGRRTPSLEFAGVRQYARRAGLERLARIASIRAEVIRTARARGASDVDAELEAIDALEQEGYYARPAQLVATRLSPNDVETRRSRRTLTPLFRISEMEFRVGLFPDIEQAIALPGTEVRYQGPYLTHTDYTTSEAVNAALAAGASGFFVETPSGFAEIHIIPPRRPTR